MQCLPIACCSDCRCCGCCCCCCCCTAARDIKAFLQNLNFSIWDLGLVGFKAACKAILLVKVATQDGGVKYRTWEPLPGVAADPTELILSDAITGESQSQRVLGACGHYAAS